jgi:hypothetical protein
MYHWKQNTYLQLVHGPLTLTITTAACFTSQLAVTIYKVLYVRMLCSTNPWHIIKQFTFNNTNF